jgi:hypothetical protein
MKMQTLITLSCFGFFINTPAYAEYGRGSEGVLNIVDNLSDALCVDATREKNRIDREDRFRLIMKFMKEVKWDYKTASRIADMGIRLSQIKCPENF